MPPPLIFYFDFSSPYGFLAAREIDSLAAARGRAVDWRPMLLGAVFKRNGVRPNLDVPLKGAYTRHDFARAGRRLGLEVRLPEPFPFSSVAAARAFYWLCDQVAAQAKAQPHARPQAQAQAKALALALYERAFLAGQDISRSESVLEVAAAQDLDRTALADGLQTPAVKARLRREVEAAIDAGVFGSPYLLVDGEPFWGYDRLPQVAAWLDSGGW